MHKASKVTSSNNNCFKKSKNSPGQRDKRTENSVLYNVCNNACIKLVKSHWTAIIVLKKVKTLPDNGTNGQKIVYYIMYVIMHA